jgi:hypothetical protein
VPRSSGRFTTSKELPRSPIGLDATRHAQLSTSRARDSMSGVNAYQVGERLVVCAGGVWRYRQHICSNFTDMCLYLHTV